MMNNGEQQSYLALVQQITALAQTGLYYSKDIYDQERYQQLIQLAEHLLKLSNLDTRYFQSDILKDVGYVTPKLDVRAVIFKNNEILLVQERSDELWSLPGGWADPGYSAAENTVKEVYEETGLTVKCTRLIALTDVRKHAHPPMFLHVYKAFFLCEIIEGALSTSYETLNVQFFSKHQLPAMSAARVTSQQVLNFFDLLDQTSEQTYFD